MGLEANSGRFRITNEDGDLRLDTDDGLFHRVGPLITGSRSYASQSSQPSRINQTTTSVVGTCHPDCTHVIGSVYFTGSSGANAIGYERWTTYLGGTLIWALTGPNLFAPPPGGIYRHYITTVVAYRFYIDGTDVVLEKRLVMEAMRAGSATIVAHQIAFNLKTGLFT
ncbi:hypothetical protein [Hyphomicrobium sp. CS1GBMeth3]|uniref:hypothetical protein n=1 Tax=Hyphomicrobium sp. CS1GBMeth3 TaxID=1892845 RepID=UPI0009307A35|nr:hypothetical protein [Hyphomicrobium sp. CS1GBMeth3]